MPAPVILDIVLLLILIGSALTGWRMGFLRSVFSAAGLIAGGISAYMLLPIVVEWMPAPVWRIVVVVGGGILLLVLGATLGSLLGRLLRRGARAIKLSIIDRLAGLVTSTVVVALVIGTIAAGLSGLGVPAFSQAMSGSIALGTIDRLTPDPAKAFLAGVRASTVNDALPWVIDTITPPEHPALADVDTGSTAVSKAAASVVRVSGVAYQCGESLTGSGFVVSDDRVVTNAHVVAGVTEAVVEAPGERARVASVVYFDPATDLAVLAVDGLDAPALALGTPLERGDGAVFQGYPFGGPFRSLPATIAEISTIPRNDGSIGREVYSFAGDVNQGNSGGPLLAPDGSVIGVVFAKSSVVDDIGYAVTDAELAPVAQQAASLSATVSSGACAG